jgi:hypothetical protein
MMMNSPKQTVSPRLAENRREEKIVQPRSKNEQRKEALVLLAIVVLFVANVLLYLCHHYAVTSANTVHPRVGVTRLVIVD